ncbi:MAG TPA: pyruvate formate-lyase-activating protein [Pyrinomonadaceae bacterium]|nr:pyruvate formate-lyase-activating protein [Pyrinomonadaceae bacterium]
MSTEQTVQAVPLEAKSPFELRVKKGSGVPDLAIKQALQTGDAGFLHSFTTGSTVDGPGVRVVAWTAGCQWRCLYCHNPDTWNIMNGTPVTLGRAVEVLKGYRHGLEVMSGGFTLSGGEPLVQDRFAVRLFAAARAMGIHTALDTNGALGHKLADAELETIDLVLLDLKAWDRERHRRLTGRDVTQTLDFAFRLADLKRPVWLRYVLVPGLTDDAEEIACLAFFASSLGNVERVEVLPFHQMGQYKWASLGLTYALADIPAPTPDAVERARKLFRAEGLNAV